MGVHPGFSGIADILLKSICGHGNNGDGLCIRSVQRADSLGSGDSVHYRHHNIHDNHVKRTSRLAAEGVHGFLPIHCGSDDCALFLKNTLSDFQIQLNILHQQSLHTLKIDMLLKLRLVEVGILVNINPKLQCKFCPLVRPTIHFYRTAHHFHKFFCDRHAKAGPFVGSTGAVVLLGKGVKEAGQEFRFHTDARIFQLKAKMCAFSLTFCGLVKLPPSPI